jgi:hypothetical protein
MTQDFRPSAIQLEYLNVDIQEHLERLGFNTQNNEYNIRTINWYNWDNNPRWFVFLDIFDLNTCSKKVGYVEVDVYAEDWNGPGNPMGIELVEIPGHGYPCNCIPVVSFEDGDYVIEE